MKHILISNDDGYNALGLRLLAQRLRQFARVTVIAPEVNHSGASNSLTLNRPMFVRQVEPEVYTVNGTPSDCVHLALTQCLPDQPDLIVSGINDGANLGEDTLYSGTVAAATEGYLFHIPAVAFSLTQKGWPQLESAVAIAAQIVQHLIQHPIPTVLLNVNIPPAPHHQWSDIRVTRLGRRHPSRPAQQTSHPSGETMYWIGPCGDVKDLHEGTDFNAIEKGCISLTPLQIDLTNHQQLATMDHWLACL